MIRQSSELRPISPKTSGPNRAVSVATDGEFEVMIGQGIQKPQKKITANSTICPDISNERIHLRNAKIATTDLSPLGLNKGKSKEEDHCLEQLPEPSNKTEQADLSIQPIPGKAEALPTATSQLMETIHPKASKSEIQDVCITAFPPASPASKFHRGAKIPNFETRLTVQAAELDIQPFGSESTHENNGLHISRHAKPIEKAIESSPPRGVREPITEAVRPKTAEWLIVWDGAAGKFQEDMAAAVGSAISQLSPSTKTMQVLTTSRDSAVPNITELRVQLHPADFGQLNIRIQTVGDSLRVIVQTETEEAYARLTIEQDDLIRSLDSQGISVADVTVLAPRNADTQANQPIFSSQTGSTLSNKERQTHSRRQDQGQGGVDKQLADNSEAIEPSASVGNYI